MDQLYTKLDFFFLNINLIFILFYLQNRVQAWIDNES